jgi:phosphatidylglycerophosphate synthase
MTMAEEPYRVGDRRPLASRSWRWSQVVAHWLARRGVAPNAISVTGMVCGVAAGAALAATAYAPAYARVFWLAAAGLVQLRLLANLLDGMVAVESGRASAVGELYNEVPDRVSDAATFIGLGYAAAGQVELGYAAACVALFTAYVRAVGKVAGAPQDYCGPMAKQQRMFVVTVVGLPCGLLPAAWQPVLGTEPVLGLPAAGLVLIVGGGLITAVRRLLHSAQALRKKLA